MTEDVWSKEILPSVLIRFARKVGLFSTAEGLLYTDACRLANPKYRDHQDFSFWASRSMKDPNFERRCGFIRDIVGTPQSEYPGNRQVGNKWFCAVCLHVFENNVWRCSCGRFVNRYLERHAWALANEGQAGKLAKAIHQEWDPVALPVLADALEDAGCQDDQILFHLRSEFGCPWCEGAGQFEDPGPRLSFTPCSRCKGSGYWTPTPEHVRGCWAVRLLAGEL